MSQSNFNLIISRQSLHSRKFMQRENENGWENDTDVSNQECYWFNEENFIIVLHVWHAFYHSSGGYSAK